MSSTKWFFLIFLALQAACKKDEDTGKTAPSMEEPQIPDCNCPDDPKVGALAPGSYDGNQELQNSDSQITKVEISDTQVKLTITDVSKEKQTVLTYEITSTKEEIRRVF